MERLDNILKSVATAAVVQVSSNIKEEEAEAEAEVKPPQKAGARRPTLPGEIHTLLHSFASYLYDRRGRGRGWCRGQRQEDSEKGEEQAGSCPLQEEEDGPHILPAGGGRHLGGEGQVSQGGTLRARDTEKRVGGNP